MKSTAQPAILVETVVDLNDKQTQLLKELFKKKFGTSAFTNSKNPSILGGIRVTVGSQRYDLSLLKKLQTITETE